MGALDKCSSYIDAVRDSANNPVLAFDAGDFLPAIPDSEQAEYIIRALREVGYDAVVVGDQEFLLGKDFFERHFAPENPKPKTPVGCFNEYLSDTAGSKKNSLKALIFHNISNFRISKLCYQNKNLGNLRIPWSLNGIIEERAFLFFPEDKKGWFQIASLKESLSSIPKSSTALIILLSHSGLMTDAEIAKSYPQIDIIIGGHSQNELFEPVIEGKTIIVQAGGFGRYVGRLDVKLENGEITDYDYHLVPMTPDIPSDTSILAIIEEYEHAFFKDKRPRPHIPVYPDTLEISSPQACMECHAQEYTAWSKEVHSCAFDILQTRRKIYNPGCLSCHTTGFGHKGGFVSYDRTPERSGIGCSECHYTPASHLLEPDKKPLPITESVCLRCHTPRNSPDFDYSGYRARAAHK